MTHFMHFIIINMGTYGIVNGTYVMLLAGVNILIFFPESIFDLVGGITIAYVSQ